MKVTVNTYELQTALKRLNNINKKIISKGLPLQFGIHVKAEYGQLILSSCNFNSMIKCSIDANTEEMGQLVIPEKTIKLLEKIKEAYITIEDTQITAGKKKIAYTSGLASNYVLIEEDITTNCFEVSQKELYRLLEVQYATAKDETKPILQGINIQQNRFASLDGFRLSVRETEEFSTDINVTMDADLWRSLYKLTDKKSTDKVKVFRNIKTREVNKKVQEYSTHLTFQFKDFSITGRLFDGEYVNYKNIIPKDFETTVQFNSVKDMIEKLDFIKTIKDNRMLVVECIISAEENNFTIKGKSMENIVSDDIDVTITGKSIHTAYDDRYMKDMLKQYKDKEMVWYLINEVSPVIVKQKDDWGMNLELLLPIRISR
jgi:DNA polymerase-3 subunit beta